MKLKIENWNFNSTSEDTQEQISKLKSTILKTKNWKLKFHSEDTLLQPIQSFLALVFAIIFKSCQQQEAVRYPNQRCHLQRKTSTSATSSMVLQKTISSSESNLQQLEPLTLLLVTTKEANVSLRAFSISSDEVSNFTTRAFVSAFSTHC